MAGEGKFPPSALIAGQEEEEEPRFPLPLPRARARARETERKREREGEALAAANQELSVCLKSRQISWSKAESQ